MWASFPRVLDPWPLLPHTGGVGRRCEGRRASQTSNPFILNLKLWLFIINILVTLLHKGQINIRCEVSSSIALGLVTFPWHMNPAPVGSQLYCNTIVVQGAKTRRIWKTAPRVPLPIPVTAVTSRWLPARCSQGASTHLFPWQIRGGSWGRVAGPVGFEAPEPGVLSQTRVQIDDNRLLGRPRCAGPRKRVFQRLGHYRFHSHLTWFKATQEYQVLRVFQSVKKKKKKKSSLLVLKVRLRESLWKDKQNGPSVIWTLIYRYLLFVLVSTKTKYIGVFCFVWFGLIQEFSIHFSPPSQHRNIEEGGVRRESWTWKER